MNYATPLLNLAIDQRPNNHAGQPRRVGVEIEFVGVESIDIADIINRKLGGSIEWISPFEVKVTDTELGTFKVELDSQGIKNIGEKSKIKGNPADSDPSIERSYIETVSSLASNLVPWEVVTPPVELKHLPTLFSLVNDLRDHGAKGTKAAPHYAFGVHLNPELPELDATTITNYLKSFFCLYEWVKAQEEPDLTRRLTPYINDFSNSYMLKVLSKDYRPSLDELISDYLESNNTRNRSLDMLPLFSHLNELLVANKVKDERVNSRPTFHYRLPNCEIAKPDWNLHKSLEVWMAVESVAFGNQLSKLCEEYQEILSAPFSTPGKNRKWIEEIDSIVSEIGLTDNSSA